MVFNKNYLLAFVFGAVLFLIFWAFLLEPGYGLRVRDYRIDLKNWSKPGYKIAVLADLHVGSLYNGIKNLKNIVEKTNQQNPDLILIAGDFVIQGVVGGEFISPQIISNELKKLKAQDGVYAVLGNHDHWHDAHEITETLEESGIIVLTNQSVLKNGFWLVGVDDFVAGKPDLKEAFKGTESKDAVIMFTHNPDLFDNLDYKLSLGIAGHTHGGQVYLPFLGRLIVPSQYGERFAIGHIVEGFKDFFVSPGTGTSILPVRFLVPPEVSILELNGK